MGGGVEGPWDLIKIKQPCVQDFFFCTPLGLRGQYHYGAFFIIPNWEGNLAFILVPKPWHPRCPWCPQYLLPKVPKVSKVCVLKPPKNLGIGKSAVLAQRLHSGNNGKRARAMFPASILLLRVSFINVLAILPLRQCSLPRESLVVMMKPPRAFATHRHGKAAGMGALWDKKLDISLINLFTTKNTS